MIGAFIAFSSAAACRRCRVSVACTRRIRPSEIPSWSAWTIARQNADTSGAADALGQLLQRLRAALADAHLAERQRELVGERAVHVLRELRHRAVEAETGLDADGEQVERVGKLAAQLLAPRAESAMRRTCPGAMKPTAAQQSAAASDAGDAGDAADEQAEHEADDGERDLRGEELLGGDPPAEPGREQALRDHLDGRRAG